MKIKLQARYALAILTLVISSVLLLAGTLLVRSQSSMEELMNTSAQVLSDNLIRQMEKRGEAIADSLAQSVVTPLYQFDLETLFEILQAVKRQTDVAYAYVYDLDGRIVHDGTKDIRLFNRLLTDEISQRALRSDKLSIQMGEDVMDVSSPILIGRERLGGVRVGLSLKRIRTELEHSRATLMNITEADMRKNLYAVGLITLALSLLGILSSFLVATGLVKPIKLLSSTTSRIGRGEYDVDIPIHRSDEIGDLADAFRRMTAELKATTVSRNFVRDIIEHMADALIVLAPDGTIQMVNPAACDLTGYSEKELIGQSAALVLPDFAGLFTSEADDSLIAGEVRTGVETTYRTRKGLHTPVVFSAAAMYGPHGQVQGAVCVAHSILERRKVEQERAVLHEQFRQAQKMQAVGTLASGIAHDFNNILQVIGAHIHLLRTKDGRSAGMEHDLAEMERAVERASGLVRRLLTFGRKVKPETKPVDLNDVIVQTVKMLERTMPKMIDIQVQLAESLKTVSGDPDQLESVLINLGANARDAMPDGGVLTFATRNVRLDPEATETPPDAPQGECVELTVSDTGSGMDAATAERVFEPFFTTKEIGRGTGLGLAMVYGVVQAHGGCVHLTSVIGRGTSFRIYLPAWKAQAAQTVFPAPQASGEWSGTESVLVVDDEAAIRETTKDVLETHGYTVWTAPDGETALEFVQRQPDAVDLVVLDLSMPGMGGHNLLRQLVRLNPNLKALVASGCLDGRQTRELLLEGAKGFLHKPFRLMDLLKTVRVTLDGLNHP